MSKLWFTADTHFDHNNIIRFCNRPFENAGDMNLVLIDNWNAVVGHEDDVYHLGDFCMSNREERWLRFIHALNGKIHLIRGNHDSWKVLDKVGENFEWVKDYFELKVQDRTVNKKVRSMTLMHYAMRVWNKSHWGVDTSIHVYGHSHSKLEGQHDSASMDVGIDNAAIVLGEHRPFAYEEVVSHIKSRCDHESKR